MWHINPTKILIQCFSFLDSFLSYTLFKKKTQICLSLWLIRLLSMVKCDFQMNMKMNSLEELYHHFPLQLPFSLLIVLEYFSYFSSPFFLLNLPYINPVKLLSLMRLTTSELTNLVGEFLELTYTWPLSSRRLSSIWKFSSPRHMLYNTSLLPLSVVVASPSPLSAFL